MGNHVEKMNEDLMQVAPLDSDIIKDIYYMHDSFWYMRMIALVCDNIVNSNKIECCWTINLVDIGNILIWSGYSLDYSTDFSKVLMLAGETEVSIGNINRLFMITIHRSLIKPIKRIVNFNGLEITRLRDELMRLRLLLQLLKKEHTQSSDMVQSVEKNYSSIQVKMKNLLKKEKMALPHFKINIIKMLETQLNTYQNSIIYLETLLDKLKNNKNSTKPADLSKNKSIDLDILLSKLTEKYSKSPLPDSSIRPKSLRNFESRSSVSGIMKLEMRIAKKKRSRSAIKVLKDTFRLKADNSNKNCNLEF